MFFRDRQLSWPITSELQAHCSRPDSWSSAFPFADGRLNVRSFHPIHRTYAQHLNHCANAAADTASITSANNSERMGGMIRIVLPFAWSSLACPVMLCCYGLRGWRGTISGRNAMHTFVSLANSSAMTFSFRSSYVWSITLTTNSQRTVWRKTRKNAGAEMNELIKIEHLVDERRCM